MMMLIRLSLRPWSVMGHYLALAPWNPNLSLAETDFSHGSFWVQAHGLPFGKLTKGYAEEIAAMLGSLIEVDCIGEGLQLNRCFLRFRVLMDLTKPLCPGFELERQNMPALFVSFKYERLSNFCYGCGRLGHEDEICSFPKNPSLSRHLAEGMRASSMKRLSTSKPVLSKPLCEVSQNYGYFDSSISGFHIQPNAQEKFLRIKHAYNTVLNSDSRKKYDSGNCTAETYNNTRDKAEAEEFYGFGDFLRDLQEEYRNWEASAPKQTKPKSLWEELAEIGEEFVEFLEKELNITDTEDETQWRYEEPATSGKSRTGSGSKNEGNKGSSIEENIDEIEAALAQLKRELGL